jgi:type VI secretion system protein ImpJ
MRNLPVHWHEGLFLRPQHFQAADRHWTELLQTTEQWSHPYPYGLYELEYSDDALANHRFEIQRLRARMRDGTIVTLDLGQEPDDVGLKQDLGELKHALAGLEEAFEKETRVRVYLGVPKLHLGRTNVAQEHGGIESRYQAAPIVIQDESAGGNDQEIELKNLNVRILLSTQDLSGFELLPIAQIKRAGEGEAVPQIDESYIPPVLSIDAWNGLGRGIVRAVFDIIGQKVEVLSQQVTNRGIGLDSRHPGDLERIMMLGQLNAAYATLSVLAFARGVHPFIAYTELARIVGQLSIFTSARRVTDIPAYDHEDLARVFQQLKLAIETSIFSVRDYEYQQRFFVGVGMGMQVSLEPQWFHSDWQWFIGVHKQDISEQEVRDLLSPGQLDWKLGSARQVELLFKRRAEGLVLRPVDRAIRALPSNQDWLYYEVARRDTPAWHDVQETQTLGMRLQDSMILNRDRLQGNRELAVNVSGRRVGLEFALFAVPLAT